MQRITRAVSAADLSVDGLTVDGVVMPYGETAEVCDDLGPTAVYREAFTPGAFSNQLRVLRERPDLRGKVHLNLEHNPDLGYRLGYLTDIRSDDDALRCTFTLIRTNPNLDLVRGMLAESHTGLSVECGIGKSRVRSDGVVERVEAHLYGAAAVPAPAYAGAGITSLRDDAMYDQAYAGLGTPRLDAAAASWGFHDTAATPG